MWYLSWLFLIVCILQPAFVIASEDAFTTADFNEDGIVDVVHAQNRGELHLWKGAHELNSKISFESQTVFAVPFRPDHLASGDFDADGHFDLVVTSPGSRSLFWIFGNGKGEFKSTAETFLAEPIEELSVVDTIRKDGLADVFIRFQSSKTILLQSPEGAFHAKPERQSAPFQPQRDVLHLNGDAIPDQIELNQRTVTIQPSAPEATFNVTNSNDSGAGSLRQAILNANSSGGADTIQFAIPGAGVPTISLLSALPVITQAVTIDGTSQQAGLVEIQGSSAGTITAALEITAGNSVVRGLVLNRITGTAILISTGGSNLIRGNRIGTDSTGTTDLGNNGFAIRILNSANNIIGGTTAAHRNLISGNNGFSAIIIEGQSSTTNSILGNFIGTDVTGTIDLGNSGNAVEIRSPNNSVGETTAGARNIISGNTTAIRISGLDATGNLVQGNYIGTDITGLLDVGNGSGISINSNDNFVGGTSPAARNLISGNGSGIQISNSSGNLVEGNWIGTDVSGISAIPNNAAGVILLHAGNNTIGGTGSSITQCDIGK